MIAVHEHEDERDDEVQTRKAELAALELSDRTSFAQEFADNVRSERAVDTKAFRSDQLAPMALAAGRGILARTDEQIARRGREKDRARLDASKRFREELLRELRLLENMISGIQARNGIASSAPNPRRRAMDRLVNENLAGDVRRGRFRELLEEEKAAESERKRLEKKTRQARRRRAGMT